MKSLLLTTSQAVDIREETMTTGQLGFAYVLIAFFREMSYGKETCGG